MKAQAREYSSTSENDLTVLQLAMNQSNVAGGQKWLSLSLLWKGRRKVSKTTVELGELQIPAAATVAGWGSCEYCN
jgi:hypothetical protein